MKLRGKILLGLVALGFVFLFWWLAAPNHALRDLEVTRRSLLRQGFKIELSEFNFDTSPELRARAARLATTTRAALTNRSRPSFIWMDPSTLTTPVGADAALVVWKWEKVRGHYGDEPWSQLHESLNTNSARLDIALQAAVSGPIRFEPIGSDRPNPLLPYLGDLKNLQNAFGVRTFLALHDGDKSAAWTNLLGATCLATSYIPEPIEVSHLVRYACTIIAGEITWNALQSRDWTDAQLADLQHRWESTDFWRGLPQTAALSRANMAATCQYNRKEKLETGMVLKEAIHRPGDAWYMIKSYWDRRRYRHQGSYEDENALLLYYRDRELDLRRAVQSPNWFEMRGLPGVTNFIPFAVKRYSPVGSLLNMRQMSMSMSAEGKGLLGRAAEAETWRRLLITALALERFRIRHELYPEALTKLGPEFVTSLPMDFMDGKPLRYRRTDEGHFVLYSVGLDCVDNGGQMRLPRQRGTPYEMASDFGVQRGIDLVWPRPASEAETERFHEDERMAEKERMDKGEEEWAAHQWSHTARRQAKVEEILKSAPTTNNEPSWRGRRLSDVLSNEQASGTNKLSISGMLTLRPVRTALEPETITFEFPIRYDALTNMGELQLYIDPCEDENSDGGCVAGQFECSRASNGNCLLAWSTIYEAPGKHALQAGLMLHDPANRLEDISGSMEPFVVTNLCQFSLTSAHFQPEFGATLRARLLESNGTCVLEIKSPAGALLKTISATTSNSVIKVFWDLTDDRGRRCTNDAFDTVFHVTLPDSGRAQTLRGP